MARAIWKGHISFGLVNVPVELHTAVREHRPRFRLLHAKDKSPVEYQRVCRRDGKAVAWDDLVKGYEYERGHFVVLTKDDFETAAVEQTHAVEILDFVEAADVDLRYFDVPYYVSPGKGGERAYAVLREALRKTGTLGVGRVILRQTQHLAGIGVVGDAIVLTLMRFADELVDESSVSLPSRSVDDKELELAGRLIDGLRGSWDPAKYKDDYRENLMRIIRSKMTGRKAKLTSHAPVQDSNVIDLMTRLRESLAKRPAKQAARRSSAKKTGNKAAAKKKAQGRRGKGQAA